MLERGIGQTVPFHFIWISVTVVYGLRRWALGWTLGVLAGICALTSAGLLYDVRLDHLDPAERPRFR